MRERRATGLAVRASPTALRSWSEVNHPWPLARVSAPGHPGPNCGRTWSQDRAEVGIRASRGRSLALIGGSDRIWAVYGNPRDAGAGPRSIRPVPPVGAAAGIEYPHAES